MAQNVALGKIEFKWKGEYSASTSYETKDLVTYLNILWICTTAGSNATPSASSEYWDEYLSGLSQGVDHGDMSVMGANGSININPVPKMRFYHQRYNSDSDRVFVGVIDWDEVQLKPYHDSHLESLGSKQEISIKSSKGLKVWENDLGELNSRVAKVKTGGTSSMPHWTAPEVKRGPQSSGYVVGTGLVNPGTINNIAKTDYVNVDIESFADSATYADKIVKTDVGTKTNSGLEYGGDGGGGTSPSNRLYGAQVTPDQSIYNVVSGTTDGYADGAVTETEDYESTTGDSANMVSGETASTSTTTSSNADEGGNSGGSY